MSSIVLSVSNPLFNYYVDCSTDIALSYFEEEVEKKLIILWRVTTTWRRQNFYLDRAEFLTILHSDFIPFSILFI